MADTINYFQLDLSINVSSFSSISFNGSNSAAETGRAGSRNSFSGVSSSRFNSVSASVNSSAVRSDSLDISNSARALEFLKSSMVKSGVKMHEAEKYSGRYAEDPILNQELNELFTLLEPLFKDDPQFRENVEKFMANFAKLTGGSTNSQISDSLGDLASKIENIKRGGSAEITQVAAVEVSIEISVSNGKVEFIQRKQTDPLIIDMDGNGFDLTSAREGVAFDIDADGAKEKVAVTKGKDAILALDKNMNGIIDDGKELFGDQNGAEDGFSELAKYDDNKDGVINAKDRVFDELKLLVYLKNSSGGYEQKISSLKSSEITSIDLSKIKTAYEEINGNSIVKKSAAYINGSNSRSLDIADALLENYRL